MYKKVIVSLLLSVFLLISLYVPYVRAAESVWYNQGFKEWFVKVYDEDFSPDNEIFGERYTAAQVQWILFSLVSLPLTPAKDLVLCAFEQDAAQCTQALVDLISVGEDNVQYASVPPMSSSDVWRDVFSGNRSLSGIGYVKEQVTKFSLVDTAEAQAEGYGYGALDVVRPLWLALRNLSYALFVLITVVFAFMIMFRIKISPQVVISIQSALPRIILTIILVTFSYAIAGFAMDLMYVILGLLSWFFSTALPLSASPHVGSYGFYYGFFTGGTANILLWFAGYLILFLVSLLFAAVAHILSSVLNVVLFAPLGGLWIILIILAVVIMLLLAIWWFIKIIWMLIKTVATILLLVMVSPLYITFGLFSESGGFGPWIKTLFANLMVFPILGIFMVLAMYFVIVSFSVSTKTIVVGHAGVDLFNWFFGFFGEPAIADLDYVSQGTLWNVPFLGDGFLGVVYVGVSAIMLSMAPKAADIVKSLIDKKPLTFGSAISDDLRGGAQLGITAAKSQEAISKTYTDIRTKIKSKAPEKEAL